jgi:Recombination endonuclease VII
VARKDKGSDREYHREWARRNPEKRKVYVQRWREKNRETILERERQRRIRNADSRRAQGAAYRAKNRERIRQYSRDYYAKNPGKHYQGRMKAHLKKKYDITPERFDEMVAEQNGRCAICGGESNGKRLHVDHCHETGKVRSLLCYGCNSGLGSFKDNIGRVIAALQYLQSWQDKHREA